MAYAEINFTILYIKANYFDVSGGKDGFVGCLLERIPTYCSHADQIWCQYQCTGPGTILCDSVPTVQYMPYPYQSVQTVSVDVCMHDVCGHRRVLVV